MFYYNLKVIVMRWELRKTLHYVKKKYMYSKITVTLKRLHLILKRKNSFVMKNGISKLKDGHEHVHND